MKRGRDPLHLTPHWHIDCRIEVDLPEDTIVGRRFLINALSTAVAVGALLFTGYFGYQTLQLRQLISTWDRRLNENLSEVREIQRLEAEYLIEANKIDQAYSLVRPEFYASEFMAHIGRTRPDAMVVDMIEWNDAGVVVRGNLRESSERASRLLGGYVEQLRKDQKVNTWFKVDLTDLDRGSSGETLRFEIMFRLHTKKA